MNKKIVMHVKKKMKHNNLKYKKKIKFKKMI